MHLIARADVVEGLPVWFGGEITGDLDACEPLHDYERNRLTARAGCLMDADRDRMTVWFPVENAMWVARNGVLWRLTGPNRGAFLTAIDRAHPRMTPGQIIELASYECPVVDISRYLRLVGAEC